jgi:hypothetical protein
MFTFTPPNLRIEMMTVMDDWILNDCFYWFVILDFIVVVVVLDFVVMQTIFNSEKRLRFNDRMLNYDDYQIFHFLGAAIPQGGISHLI